MEQILNNIGEGVIIVNCNGEILFCNSSALRYLKYAQDELKSENLFMTVMRYSHKIEADVSKQYELINRFNEKQTVEGKFIPSKWEGKDSFSFIFKIEEINMKKLSEKLYYELKKNRETEAELEGFLSTATDCMTIVSEDGKVEKINVGWRNSFDWTIEDFKYISLREIIHPDDIEKAIKKLNNSKESCELVRFEGRIKNKAGKWLWISTSSVFDKDRRVFISTSKDITEEKRIEEERKKYERLRELENVKSDFFANISHEFKTPLNIILSLIQLMDYSIEENMVKIEPVDKFKKYIQGIRQNSFRLLRLSNNMIDMTKIDSGFYKIHKNNCNIVHLIDNIVDSISEYVECKGIELIFDPACEELITACDEEKIERIMLNILSNSIKYIEGKGKILIRLNVENGCVVISVEDNGIGISKENLDIIFERFKQVDSTFTRKVEGSGIGLSLVKSLVEMHDGEIYVESEEGKGTKVKFYLPILILDEEENVLEHNLNENHVWRIEFADIYD